MQSKIPLVPILASEVHKSRGYILSIFYFLVTFFNLTNLWPRFLKRTYISLDLSLKFKRDRWSNETHKVFSLGSIYILADFSLKGLCAEFQMSLQAKMAMPDSQQYLKNLNLIRNVEDTVVLLTLKVFNS